MPSDEEAFLTAMRAAPADRTLRLVYADWLEERGDARHEVVRVCEAMRCVPVWSDEYWALKARRNELWTASPIEWLEATGYDGSDYDPVFRDGVPDGVRERWRLIREFTERWHGVPVPDVGGQRDVIAREEARLGLELPESVREFVAYVSDLGAYGTQMTPDEDRLSLFRGADTFQLTHWVLPPAITLINFSVAEEVLCVALNQFSRLDPPTRLLPTPLDGDEEYSETYCSQESQSFDEPCTSLSILRWVAGMVSNAGRVESSLSNSHELTHCLERDFASHTQFLDAQVFESREMFAILRGLRGNEAGSLERELHAIVRRPISPELVPDVLFKRHSVNWSVSGLFHGEHHRRLSADGHSPGTWGYGKPQWASVLRRQEVERLRQESRPTG